MDIILEKYTKLKIAEICQVQPKTVHNWFVNRNIPFWAIDVLGYELVEKDVYREKQ